MRVPPKPTAAKRARLFLETLEAREVLYSASGNAWPNPQLITIGFVPDGTIVGSTASGAVASNLQSAFDNHTNATFRSSWRSQILKAAQVWAQQTNINFALVSDNGADIGSGAYQQGDPNQADIRIGGYDFGTTTLSQAYLPAPLNNTSFAGDIQFNTGQSWNVGSTYDLFTVAVHEFGHALGLNHSTVNTSVLWSAYTGVKSALAADDISGIRAVVGYNAGDFSSPGYGGARAADSYDAAAANGTFAAASTVTSAINTTTKTALLTNLDITTTSDADYYKFVVPTGLGGTMSLAVQTTGQSLLAPTVTLYNASQTQVATATAGTTDFDGSTVTVSYAVTAGTTYYVKVAGASATAFGTGRYALALGFAGTAAPTASSVATQTANGLTPSGGAGEPIALSPSVRASDPSYNSSLWWYGNAPRATAMDAVGNYVVTYAVGGKDGSGNGVYARLYAADGTPRGPEFLVNQTTANDQLYPAVAMGASGNFVVVWQSYSATDWDVYARRFAADGTPLGGEFLVNQTTVGLQSVPMVAMNASDNFVVSWTDGATGNWDVKARTYLASGAARTNEFVVNTTTAYEQNRSSLGIDRNDNVVVAWQSNYQDGSEYGIYARRFNAVGTPLTAEFQVNTSTAGMQDNPTVAMADNGNFVIAWNSVHADASGDVFAQRFTVSGTPAGAEFRVNEQAAGIQKYPSVAIQPGGNFLVTWESGQRGVGTEGDVVARTFRMDGVPLSKDFLVNNNPAGHQGIPAAAMNSDGAAVVVWSDTTGGVTNSVFSRRLMVYTDSSLSNMEAGVPHPFNPDGCDDEDHDHDHDHESSHEPHTAAASDPGPEFAGWHRGDATASGAEVSFFLAVPSAFTASVDAGRAGEAKRGDWRTSEPSGKPARAWRAEAADVFGDVVRHGRSRRRDGFDVGELDEGW